MIAWTKLRGGIATNAKIAKVGTDGALVYLAALCQHLNHSHGGRIPVRRMEPATLRVEAVALLGRMSEARISTAVVKCCAVGLLQLDGDDYVISGYDESSMPSCVKCHNSNSDHRFSCCPRCRENAAAARRASVSPIDANVSPRTGQDRTGNNTRARARGGAARSPRPEPGPVEHMRNMPLGHPSCFCAECIAKRARDAGGSNLRAVQ